ncbi:MAG TPA: branched-chain amino acid ABC transporter permease [Pseudolabrys sp.]|jgi:branched-chain amino acid transport system permease protein|nr:branched-chain amino acid ABC transporter permease [Pseudolabrys sp.]
MSTGGHPTNRRLRIEFIVSLAILLVVAGLPAIVTNAYWQGVIVVSMYFAMLSIAWNILAGYAGQFSLAPAAFGMIGAYATGLLAYYYHTGYAIGIPAAIVVSGLIGLVLGRIVLRLRGPYLALTTLSFAEIMRLVISNSIEITRGDLGLNVPGIFQERLPYYYLMIGVLLIIQVGLFYLLRSRAGLYLRAIRDDEIAAASRGVRIVYWKTFAFTLSAAICGLGGALYGHFAHFVSPELGLLQQTGVVISMVVIGGLGTMVGPLIGALLVYVTSEFLRDVGNYQLVVFAFLVIIFARFFRAGLWGLVLLLLGVRAPRPLAAAPATE